MGFEHMTLFTTALCNLNCGYCYICKDKQGGLAQIDKDIEKDFENNAYIKQVLNYDPNLSNTITGITLWGGEPFLHSERFVDHIEDYVKAFPKLNFISTSTNFSLPNQVEKIQALIDAAEKHLKVPEYTIDLQISIDGYEEMNDAGRGEGVTKKFLKNFRDMCNNLTFSKKTYLMVHTKPTLSRETMHFLDTEEKCFQWYDFFDKELYKPYHDSGAKFDLTINVFNCAAPTEWTKEDGKQYAQILRNIQSVTPKVFEHCPGWRNTYTLVPMASTALFGLMTNCDGCVGRNKFIRNLTEAGANYRNPRCGGGCGSFTGNIVPIPKGNFTMCHRGVFDEYVEYANNIHTKEGLNGLSDKYFGAKNYQDWIYTPEQLKHMNNSMTPLNTVPSQFLYTDLILMIREYAKVGLVDAQYEDVTNIEKTLGGWLETSYCLQDGYIMSGSWTTRSFLEIPLYYNGAMQVITEEIERVYTEAKEKEVI